MSDNTKLPVFKIIWELRKLKKIDMKNVLETIDGFKTLIFGAVNVLALFLPGVSEWIANNPEEYGQLVVGAFVALRIFTKRSIAKIAE